MTTAIVILNWNGAEMLRRFLPPVITHSTGAEIIVADNASTDDSLKILGKEFPSVRTIVLDKNYGFAEGYNRALAQVEADVFVLLNSDVLVTEGWLCPILKYLEENPDCAACQPKILQYDNGPTTRFEYAGAAGGYIDRYGYPYCRGRIFGTIEEDYGQYDTTASIMWASGAALVIRATDWRQTGGLDGSFFAHQEEIDLCWRLHSRGRDVVCCPESVVYHVGGGTLPQGNPRKTYLNFRNNLLLLYKNLPTEELEHIMRVRRYLDAVAAIKELLTGHWDNYKAIRQARHDFESIRQDYVNKRADNIHHTTTYYNICGRARGSLLVSYYLLWRKTYSKLKF